MWGAAAAGDAERCSWVERGVLTGPANWVAARHAGLAGHDRVLQVRRQHSVWRDLGMLE